MNLISSLLMDFNNAVKQDPGPQLFGNNMGWPKNEGYSWLPYFCWPPHPYAWNISTMYDVILMEFKKKIISQILCLLTLYNVFSYINTYWGDLKMFVVEVIVSKITVYCYVQFVLRTWLYTLHCKLGTMNFYSPHKVILFVIYELYHCCEEII